MKNKQTKTITRVFSPLPKTVTETGSLYLIYSKIFPRNADFKEAHRSIVGELYNTSSEYVTTKLLMIESLLRTKTERK